MDGVLQKIVATQCTHTYFQPMKFFVSWNGVLCLVYKGFPPPIARLKTFLPLACNLPQENPGSRWPKTSLAALNDKNTLTEDELALLLSLCEASSSKLSQECMPVSVKKLTYVHYMCRCLATALLRCNIQLPDKPLPAISCEAQGLLAYNKKNPEDCNRELVVGDGCSPAATLVKRGAALCSADEPDEAEVQNTQRVVSAAQDVKTYWKDVAREGHRASHYMSAAQGSSLVHYLAESENQRQQNRTLLDCIQDFKAVVDEHFPGRYSFFNEDSLHITIRALS